MSDSMIESSATRLFSENVDKPLLEKSEQEFQSALWTLTSESGFTLALVPEAAGGIGADWTSAYPLLRGIGYWQVPLPLAETMVASLLLSLAGIELPDGPITLIEQGIGNALTITADGTATLNGSANAVPWARNARWAVVSHSGGAIALVDLKDAGVTLTEHSNRAAIPADQLRFANVRASANAPAPLPALTRPVLTLGALARSMQIVGALEWAAEQTVQYANDRVQFGKPIGKNQAIQQQLALLAGDVAATRMATLVAASDAPSAVSADCTHTLFSTAVAKIRAGQAATSATSTVHQVHGAIGFTYEHQLHFATRRLWSWREEFGSDAWWAERLGKAAIGARAVGFWPSLTRRAFDAMAV